MAFIWHCRMSTQSFLLILGNYYELSCVIYVVIYTKCTIKCILQCACLFLCGVTVRIGVAHTTAVHKLLFIQNILFTDEPCVGLSHT